MALRPGGKLDACEICSQIFEVFREVSAVSKNDAHIACFFSRSPNPIVVVSAKRLRQAVVFAEEIDGPCLAIVADVDYTLSLLLWRKASKHLGHGSDHLFPAKLVSIMLGTFTLTS